MQDVGRDMLTQRKKVLITGADGFIGSHLVELMIDEGFHVKAFCFYNSSSSLGWLDHFPEEKLRHMEIVTGDIRDADSLRDAMKNINVVFHLAALISIPYSYLTPESYVDTNIGGTLNILQASKDSGVERVLITSSSEVYGTAQTTPITESHPRQAQSPYAATKISADALAQSYYKSFDLPVSIVRPFNTYGPRQSTRAVIPSIITQLLGGQKVLKMGDLRPSRDFVFVKDTVRGMFEVSKCDALIGQDVNIATGQEITIEKLANELIQQIDPGVTLQQEKQRLRPSDSEVYRLCGSHAKLKEYTGWSPQISFKDGLQRTIDWFRKPENLRLYRDNKHFNI